MTYGNPNQTSPSATPPQQYASLPIIEHLIKVYMFWGDCAVHFPKHSRYTLGTKIEWALLEVSELVFGATTAERTAKLPFLDRAAKKIDLAKFLLRVAWESRALDNKKYIALSEKLNEIGRMLGGWQRKIIKETPATKAGER